MSESFGRKELIKRLVDFEGMVLHVYKCSAGYETIGVGRNINQSGVGISEEEALYLLSNDIDRVIEELNKFWPVWKTFPQEAQYVVIDLVFNMGINTFNSFRKTKSYMELGEWEKAADELLNSRYAKQVGRRALFNSEELRKCQQKPKSN
tara:strand:- start:791 stop:1240 length:450 start_codon:yes stop_codon:yes gene_type:complete